MTRRVIPVLAIVGLLAFGCGEGNRMTDEEATARFAACLERNGIVAEGLTVRLDDDGSVALIEVRILAEGDVPYQPAIELACTAELEGS